MPSPKAYVSDVKGRMWREVIIFISLVGAAGVLLLNLSYNLHGKPIAVDTSTALKSQSGLKLAWEKQFTSEGQEPISTASSRLPPAAEAARRTSSTTLVVYVYNPTDEEELENVQFFLKYGITTAEGVLYKIVATSGGNVIDIGRVALKLPPNVALLQAPACPDTNSVWAAVGAVKSQVDYEMRQRSHLVVIDSSSRGPYLPPYALSSMHWTEAFTAQIDDYVKLVGSAISCEGAPFSGDVAGQWRDHPYVMSWAWAVDAEGWRAMSADLEVFKCYSNAWDVRYYSDSGASLALMKAGFGIGTLMTKYQGVDWWNKATWGCNGKVRPDKEMTYDGISLSPFETLFVPMNNATVSSGWTSSKAARKYGEWMDSQDVADPAPKSINTNEWITDSWRLKSEKLITMNARGPGCFDFKFYLDNNPDLMYLADKPLAVWEHFLVAGQFQGRTHRFSCSVQIGHAYRTSYLRLRGRRCFDHTYYLRHNLDLFGAGLSDGEALWGHWTSFGQWENRRAR